MSSQSLPESKRLHVTPFNAELLPIVLSGDLLHRASDISFHTLQSFPESNFGFVNLPVMEADKLKKKLNGSILRGTRMRVEEARPIKLARSSGEDQVSEDGDSPQKRLKGQKKQRIHKSRDVDVGFELPEGRKVQRGWTNATVASDGRKVSKKADHKSSVKTKAKASQFSDGPECLFKTKIPPNVANLANPLTEATSQKRKGKNLSNETVIHEFSNTTRHASFLRGGKNASDKKRAFEYLEGKGWVDEDGNFIEPGPKNFSKKPKTEKIQERKGIDLDQGGSLDPEPCLGPSPPEIQPSDSMDRKELSQMTARNSSYSSFSSSDSDEDIKDNRENERMSPGFLSKDKSSDVGDASKKLSNDVGIYDSDDVVPQPSAVSVENQSSAGSGGSTQPSTKAEEPARKIHPLESLFKRPKTAASKTTQKPNLEVSTSFTFFDPDKDEESNTGFLAPQTPFTQQDYRQRRQRSAAPTPDTAAPGRTFGDIWPTEMQKSKGDDEKLEMNLPAQGKASEATSESEFSKWFWENRGENNRSWKRRRREAAKERRHKEKKR